MIEFLLGGMAVGVVLAMLNGDFTRPRPRDGRPGAGEVLVGFLVGWIVGDWLDG